MIRVAVNGAAHPYVQRFLDELVREYCRGLASIEFQDSNLEISRKSYTRLDLPSADELDSPVAEATIVVMTAATDRGRGWEISPSLQLEVRNIADKPALESFARLSRSRFQYRTRYRVRNSPSRFSAAQSMEVSSRVLRCTISALHSSSTGRTSAVCEA